MNTGTAPTAPGCWPTASRLSRVSNIRMASGVVRTTGYATCLARPGTAADDSGKPFLKRNSDLSGQRACTPTCRTCGRLSPGLRACGVTLLLLLGFASGRVWPNVTRDWEKTSADGLLWRPRCQSAATGRRPYRLLNAVHSGDYMARTLIG